MPRFKYQADGDSVHWIRLSNAVKTAAGAEPNGAVTSELSVKVSRGNRQIGLRPRFVRLTRTEGEEPNIVIKRTRIPVLTKANWNHANYALGASLQYKGQAWTIFAKVPEDYN